MLIQIQSSNPNLSYLLAKNPESGLQGQTLRKGFLWHYFKNPSHYIIFFQDNPDIMDMSYPKKDDEKNYLDKSAYISAYSVFDIISHTLNHLLKDDLSKYEQYEDNSTYIFTCTMEIIAKRNIEIFSKYAAQYGILIRVNQSKFDKNIYYLTFTGNKLDTLIKFVYVFSVYNSIYNNDKIQLQESFAKKLVNIVNILDMPFFVRYLLKKNILFVPSIYKQVKSDLEESNKYKIEFVTQANPTDIRYNYIVKQIDTTKKCVVEIGFGEGRILKRLAKIFDVAYGADIDEDYCERMEYIAKNNSVFKDKLHVVQFDKEKSMKDNVNSLINIIAKNHPDSSMNDVVVVCSEVIEHMELEEAKSMLNELLSFNIGQIVLTTPNKDMNKFMDMGENELRHEDHKYELTKYEFNTILQDLVALKPYTYNIHDIGDRVNDVGMWLGATITLNEYKR